jgi:hypothetical protein
MKLYSEVVVVKMMEVNSLVNGYLNQELSMTDDRRLAMTFVDSLSALDYVNEHYFEHLSQFTHFQPEVLFAQVLDNED